MEEEIKDIKEVESNPEKKESKKKKKVFIIIGIILLIILTLILWWFNRKFDVTIKYNNGTNDKEVKVKYLHKVDKKLLDKDIKLDNHTFIGYFETYKLANKKEDCKVGFRLDDKKKKCISKEEYDVNTKIKSKKTVEALWSTIIFDIDPKEKEINIDESFNITVTLSGTSDTSVKWSSEDESIAKVDESGKVVGVKEGKTTIVAESNGIKKKCSVTVNKVEEKEEPKEEKKEEPKQEVKDNGTVKLSASDQCIIGNDDVVTITATLNNAIDKTVNWNLPKCYTIEKVSNTVVKLNRTGRGTQCRTEEERSFTVQATLNNGNSDSLTFTFEPTLDVKVYRNGRDELTIGPSGIYYGNGLVIKTNTPSIFSINNADDYGSNPISSSSDIEVKLNDGYSDLSVNIKTTCGQNKTVIVNNNIN